MGRYDDDEQLLILSIPGHINVIDGSDQQLWGASYLELVALESEIT